MPEPKPKSVVGEPLDRVDGRLKVTGGAKYAAEFNVPNLAYGALVQATIGRGTVTRIDAAAASRAPGVIAVVTPDNLPPVAKPTVPPAGAAHPLLSKEILFSGQDVAVVVAETFEQAEHAADLVKLEYRVEKPQVVMEDQLAQAYTPGSAGRRTTSRRGNYEAGLASATAKIDQIYRTPTENHNPMEPHATIAVWTDDNHLVAYDATQGVGNSARNLAEQFGLPGENVQVIDPFVGGGFGCKGQAWPHSAIAALAAKVAKRPVKIALTRKQMFWSNGHRPETRQALTLGAASDGKLLAIGGRMVNHTSRSDEFLEPTGNDAATTYSCPNVDVELKLVRLDVPAPTYMRAPGEASGSFNIETAMDELAYELGVDPIELRLTNYAGHDEETDRPYSSKSLRECYAQAATAFGWGKRSPKPRSMRSGRYLVGYGMAGAAYPANYRPCAAKARMQADGSVTILCGTQDLGTGTYTILTQVAAEALGMSPAQVRVEIGDSKLPAAPSSGGSTSAASAGSAVHDAALALKSTLIGYATDPPGTPLAGLNPADITVADGKAFYSKDPSKAMTYRDIMAASGKTVVEQEAFVGPGIERGRPVPPAAPQLGGAAPSSKGNGYTMRGFGVQFCEVHVDPDLGSIRVARFVSAFAVGKPLNEKTLRSQLMGGIIFGIGMALLEESVWDPRYGRIVNSNLAECHLPTNRDAPPIQVIVIPEKDQFVNPIGVKGAGEIGITGVCAAIGNAVYHATGKRVRDLPITLDKIL